MLEMDRRTDGQTDRFTDAFEKKKLARSIDLGLNICNAFVEMESDALRPILEKKNLVHTNVKFWMGAVKLEKNIVLDIMKKIDGENIAFLTHSQPEVGKKWSLAIADPEKRFPFICRSGGRDFWMKVSWSMLLHKMFCLDVLRCVISCN